MINFDIIGSRIKKMRKERNLSQQELGDIIGVTKVSICGYENGIRFPSVEKISNLADYFETTIDYMLGNDIKIENERVFLSYEDIELLKKIKEEKRLYRFLLTNTERRLKRISKIFGRR